jgi:hypothetical protein
MHEAAIRPADRRQTSRNMRAPSISLVKWAFLLTVRVEVAAPPGKCLDASFVRFVPWIMQ